MFKKHKLTFKAVAIFIIALLIFPPSSFARKGRGGGSAWGRFLEGGISAAATAVSIAGPGGLIGSEAAGLSGALGKVPLVGGHLAGFAQGGGIAAAVGSSVSSLTGAALFAADASPKTAALVSGAVSGLAGGIVGGWEQGAKAMFANTAISVASSTAQSYTSFALSEKGVAPMLASTAGAVAGMGVGVFGTKIAGAAGAWDDMPVYMKENGFKNSGGGDRFNRDTINPHTIKPEDKIFLPQEAIPNVNNPNNDESFSATVKEITPEAIEVDVGKQTLSISHSKMAIYQLKLGNTYYQPGHYSPLGGLNWGRYAATPLKEIFLRTVPKMLVSSGVEFGVASALGYDVNARERKDINRNRFALAIGSLVGGFAGDIAQAGIDTVIPTPEYDRALKNVEEKGAKEPVSPLKAYFTLTKKILPRAIGLGVRLGIDKMTSGRVFDQNPGLRTVASLFAGTLSQTIAEEFWPGIDKLKKKVEDDFETFHPIWEKVKKSPDYESYRTLLLGDVNEFEEEGFGSRLIHNLAENFTSISFSSVPTVGISQRTGIFAFRQDGGQPILAYLNNLSDTASFIQGVSQGISPASIIAFNSDSISPIIMSSRVGDALSGAIYQNKIAVKYDNMHYNVDLDRVETLKNELEESLKEYKELKEDLKKYGVEIPSIEEALKKDVTIDVDKIMDGIPENKERKSLERRLREVGDLPRKLNGLGISDIKIDDKGRITGIKREEYVSPKHFHGSIEKLGELTEGLRKSEEIDEKVKAAVKAGQAIVTKINPQLLEKGKMPSFSIFVPLEPRYPLLEGNIERTLRFENKVLRIDPLADLPDIVMKKMFSLEDISKYFKEKISEAEVEGILEKLVSQGILKKKEQEQIYIVEEGIDKIIKNKQPDSKSNKPDDKILRYILDNHKILTTIDELDLKKGVSQEVGPGTGLELVSEEINFPDWGVSVKRYFADSATPSNIGDGGNYLLPKYDVIKYNLVGGIEAHYEYDATLHPLLQDDYREWKRNLGTSKGKTFATLSDVADYIETGKVKNSQGKEEDIFPKAFIRKTVNKIDKYNRLPDRFYIFLQDPNLGKRLVFQGEGEARETAEKLHISYATLSYYERILKGEEELSISPDDIPDDIKKSFHLDPKEIQKAHIVKEEDGFKLVYLQKGSDKKEIKIDVDEGKVVEIITQRLKGKEIMLPPEMLEGKGIPDFKKPVEIEEVLFWDNKIFMNLVAGDKGIGVPFDDKELWEKASKNADEKVEEWKEFHNKLYTSRYHLEGKYDYSLGGVMIPEGVGRIDYFIKTPTDIKRVIQKIRFIEDPKEVRKILKTGVPGEDGKQHFLHNVGQILKHLPDLRKRLEETPEVSAYPLVYPVDSDAAFVPYEVETIGNFDEDMKYTPDLKKEDFGYEELFPIPFKNIYWHNIVENRSFPYLLVEREYKLKKKDDIQAAIKPKIKYLNPLLTPRNPSPQYDATWAELGVTREELQSTSAGEYTGAGESKKIIKDRLENISRQDYQTGYIYEAQLAQIRRNDKGKFNTYKLEDEWHLTAEGKDKNPSSLDIQSKRNFYYDEDNINNWLGKLNGSYKSPSVNKGSLGEFTAKGREFLIDDKVTFESASLPDKVDGGPLYGIKVTVKGKEQYITPYDRSGDIRFSGKTEYGEGRDYSPDLTYSLKTDTIGYFDRLYSEKKKQEVPLSSTQPNPQVVKQNQK